MLFRSLDLVAHDQVGDLHDRGVFGGGQRLPGHEFPDRLGQGPRLRLVEPLAFLPGRLEAGAALAVYVVGRLSHQALWTRVGADLIDAQIVNGVLTTGLKVAVDRTRPNGGHRSFPSGHTSSTFATAAVIQRDLGWRAALPVYALGAYVGTSRVVDRAHFVSDVVFGTAVGLVSGRAVTVGHGRTRASVSAVPLRGGAALTVSIH